MNTSTSLGVVNEMGQYKTLILYDNHPVMRSLISLDVGTQVKMRRCTLYPFVAAAGALEARDSVSGVGGICSVGFQILHMAACTQ